MWARQGKGDNAGRFEAEGHQCGLTPHNRLPSCHASGTRELLDISSARAQVSMGPSMERIREPDRKDQRERPEDLLAIVRND